VIERFNFYDVYGYLIPGVVLLLCVGLPFLLSGTKVELNEWMALIVGVVVAYLAGHIIQTMATTAIPSSRDPERRSWQYYSATILNPESSGLSAKTKDRLQSSVQDWFGLDLSIGKPSDQTIGAARQDAFLLARRVVNAASNYSEQLEGLYVMMRGITVALWLGIAFTIGWALASNLSDRNVMLPVFFGSLAALLARSVEQFYGKKPTEHGATAPKPEPEPKRKPLAVWWERFLSTVNRARRALTITYWREHFFDMTDRDRRAASIACIAALGWSLFAAGFLMSTKQMAPNQARGFLLIALVYLAASFRFWNSYYYFAEQFGKSVWLHFAAEPTVRPKET
jgi:hypothetical protein